MKWYFGPSVKQEPYPSPFVNIVLFKSDYHPTNDSHGAKVRYCYGGYSTRGEAVQWAHYQFPCVRQFVRLDGTGIKV